LQGLFYIIIHNKNHLKMTTQNIYDAIFAYNNYIVPFRKNAKTKTVNVINGAWRIKLIFTKTDEKTNDTNVFRTVNGEFVECAKMVYYNLLLIFKIYDQKPNEILNDLVELNMVTITKDIKAFANQAVVIEYKQDTHLRIFENEKIIAVLFVDNRDNIPVAPNEGYKFVCRDEVNKEYKYAPKIHFRIWDKIDGLLIRETINNNHITVANALIEK
jgi:hypothetical protein